MAGRKETFSNVINAHYEYEYADVSIEFWVKLGTRSSALIY